MTRCAAWASAVIVGGCVGSNPAWDGHVDDASGSGGSDGDTAAASSSGTGPAGSSDGDPTETSVADSTGGESTTEPSDGVCAATPAEQCHSGPVLFPTPGYDPRAIALGDLDEAGLDVVVTDEKNDVVLVLRNDGDGLLQVEPAHITHAGPSGLVVADRDGDGDVDVLTANRDADDFAVFDNRGGTLGAASFVPTGNHPRAIGLTDLDDDGVPDLVSANFDENDVSVLLADGAGGYSAENGFSVGNRPLAMCVAHVDDDGWIDIITVNEETDDISVLWGTGAGGFSGETRITARDKPQAIAAGVLDGVGTDIVIGHKDAGGMMVVFGDGTRELGEGVDIAVDEDPIAFAIADVNAEGHMDVVVAHGKATDVHLLLGDDTGAFTSVPLAVGHAMAGVGLGDINGDDVPEIVLTLPMAHAIAVLMSQP